MIIHINNRIESSDFGDHTPEKSFFGLVDRAVL